MKQLTIFFAGNGLGQVINLISLLKHVNSRNPELQFHVVFQIPAATKKEDFLYTLGDMIDAFLITNITYDADFEPKEGDIYLRSYDSSKVFSPYFNADFYMKDGVKIERNYKRGKKKIALSMYSFSTANEVDSELDAGNRVFPYYRYYHFNEYQKIVELVMRAGYDIVTLNTRRSLVEVLDILNSCDALISYEGGIAHLAHVIELPCIILPWRADADMKEELHIQRPKVLHLDRKTYILDSIDEITGWDSAQLLDIIDKLYDERGNNELVGNAKVEYVPWNVDQTKMVFATNNIPIGLTDEETAFMAKYLKLPVRLGG